MLITLFSIMAAVFISALLGSLIGLGGGFLMVPILSIFVGLPIHEAIGLSLISIVGVSSSASVNYILNNSVDFRTGAVLELATVVGGILGANIALILESTYLYLIFGIILMYVSILMYRGSDKSNTLSKDGGGSKKRLGSGVLISFVAGIFAGLLGIGGGVLKVPIMTLYLGLPMKIAIGTSEFMISITSFASSFIYLSAGKVSLSYVGPAFLSAILGAQIGSRLGIKTEASILRKIFTFVMLFFAITMLIKGLTI